MMLQPCPQFPENNHNPAAMAPDDMTFLEWQRARLKQLQLQLHQSYFASTPTALDLCPNPFPAVHPPASTAAFHTCSDFGNQSVDAHELPGNTSPDLIHNPILGNSFLGGGEEGGGGGVVHELGGDGPSLLRTFSCLPVAGDGEGKATPSAPAPPSDRGEGAAVAAAAIQYSAVDGGRENWRKRKAAHGATSQEPGSCYTDALLEPKLETPSISSTTITTTADGKDHKPTSTNREASSGDASKKKCPKVSDPSSKIDYIHVRARRGQATDSHSLAERARREKISKRMKLLQELVPGCSKISGKAGVLDEIINYVQSLQRQVEFLSMKLAAVNPILDSNNIDAFLMNKEMIPHCGGMVPSLVGTTLPLEPLDAAFLSHLNTMQTQQAVAPAVECSSLDQVAVNSSCPGEQAPLLQHLTPGAPLSVSEGCPVMDSYKVRALAATNPWEAHFDGLYTVYELQQLGLGVGAAPVIGDH